MEEQGFSESRDEMERLLREGEVGYKILGFSEEIAAFFERKIFGVSLGILRFALRRSRSAIFWSIPIGDYRI